MIATSARDRAQTAGRNRGSARIAITEASALSRSAAASRAPARAEIALARRPARSCSAMPGSICSNLCSASPRITAKPGSASAVQHRRARIDDRFLAFVDQRRGAGRRQRPRQVLVRRQGPEQGRRQAAGTVAAAASRRRRPRATGGSLVMRKRCTGSPLAGCARSVLSGAPTSARLTIECQVPVFGARLP